MPLSLRDGHEAAGISRCSRWRGCGVAAGGASAAASDAGDRVPRPPYGWTRSRSVCAHPVRAYKESGYVEGENVAIVYRFAENPDRSASRTGGRSGSPAGRRDRHVRQVSATFAAKAATTTIPIVFITGDDPVRQGLVASLARPGGNLTGNRFFFNRANRKAAGTPARAGARSSSCGRDRQSGRRFRWLSPR